VRDYAGREATGLPIGSHVPNKGYWIELPQVAADADADPRSGPNARAGIEAAIDRTVWIAHRMVNGLEGGTYPGSITWNPPGSQVYNSSVTYGSGGGFVCNVTQPEFTNGLHVTAGQTNLDAAVDIDGALTAHGGAAFPAGSVVQFGDSDVHVGDDAYRSERVASGSAADLTISLWKADLWLAPVTAVNHVWTLAHPPGNAIVTATVYVTALGAGYYTLTDGGTVVTLGTGNYRSAILKFTGSAWTQVDGIHA